MQIKFELERKDILAFHLRTIFHNRTIRVLYLASFLFTAYNTLSPYVSFLLHGNLVNDERFLWSFISSALLSFGSGLLVTLTIFVVFNVFWLAILMLKYKKGDGTLGEHLIELRENALFEASDVNETSHGWKSVQKIIDLKDYIYVYVSPTNAHIIPKRYFQDSQTAAMFLSEVERLKAAAANNYSPSYLASNS